MINIERLPPILRAVNDTENANAIFFWPVKDQVVWKARNAPFAQIAQFDTPRMERRTAIRGLAKRNEAGAGRIDETQSQFLARLSLKIIGICIQVPLRSGP